MKQVLIQFQVFIMLFIGGFVQAQTGESKVSNTNIQQDTYTSFINGRTFYSYGVKDYMGNHLPASELNFRHASEWFELHLKTHPGHDSTIYYLRDTYSLLLKISNDLKRDEKTMFALHYFYGSYLLMGDPLSDSQPDYGKAFQEFEQALGYNLDFQLDATLLYEYKGVLYQHASILYQSYLDNIPDTISVSNNIVEQPVWDSCIGGRQLERCFDDLNLLVSIGQDADEKCIYDTLALVLLGKCHFYRDEYEKATDCYERSGITPEQLVLSDDLYSIYYFMLSYIQLGEANSEQYKQLWKAEAEYWYKHYRVLYMDQACYKDKEIREKGIMLNYAQIAMAYFLVNGEYAKGLDFWFKIKNNFSFDGTLKCYQGWCRYFLNDFTACEDLEFAAALNSKDRLAHLGVLLSNLNNGKLISSMPLGDTLNTIDTLYYLFGGLSSYYGNDYKAANEHFMAQDSVNAEMQAFCYQMLAEQESDPEQREAFIERANEYFRKVIAEEDSTGKFSEAPYAYLFLGDKKKAVEIMKHILQTDIINPALTLDDSLACWGVYHQAAEIYAQVGELKKAKKHLKKSLEYCHNPMILALIEKAPLLTPIREYVEQEVTKYKQQMEKAESPIHRHTIVCEIPFRKNGLSNVRTINTCYINDSLVEDMLFDPGADYVQLTKKEADRIGITEKDYIGWTPLGSANGKMDPMPLVSLDKLRIDSIELENVQAVINTTPGAPLLLGCTVWNNLTVEMPANKMIIRLTYIKESIEIPENKQETPKNN